MAALGRHRSQCGISRPLVVVDLGAVSSGAGAVERSEARCCTAVTLWRTPVRYGTDMATPGRPGADAVERLRRRRPAPGLGVDGRQPGPADVLALRTDQRRSRLRHRAPGNSRGRHGPSRRTGRLTAHRIISRIGSPPSLGRPRIAGRWSVPGSTAARHDYESSRPRSSKMPSVT
jgi:hypothetical protein